MRDLWIHENDLIVATHGRSFWILDDIAPLRETSAAIANAAHLFAPAPAYRIQRDTNTDTPLPPDEPAAANPPDGAILDYFLPAAASTVTLEILDAQGHLVRRFSNTDKPDITEDELQKQLIPLYWVRKPRQLSTEAGMHRWVWDLHYPAAGIDAPRISDRRDSARHAAFAAGADGAAGHLYCAADGRRKNFHRAADDQDGPARQNFGGGAAEKIPDGDTAGFHHDRIGASASPGRFDSRSTGES